MSGVDRRAMMIGGTAMLVAAATPAVARDDGGLATLERGRGGRLGVFALDVQSGRTLAYRADERFKLQSTFKALLVGLVLADVGRGTERLDAVVRFGTADLLPASPVTTAAVGRGALSVRALCEAIMYRSDNTAANLLMARRGGPRRLTAFARSLGDPVTRIDHYEGHLGGNPPADDTTTPRAMTGTVRRLLLGPTLSLAARAQWEAWMVGNVVGTARLRAAFPPTWRSGDRTGTADGICNDVAFSRPPGTAPLFVSTYHAAPGMALADQEAVLRAVGRIVVAWQRG